MTKMKNGIKNQGLPIALTVVIFVALVALLWLEIKILNIFTPSDIVLEIRAADVLIGLTIYLKTAIDFAIFIGRLMGHYPGLKGRIAIELGTAIGNALGTMIIIVIWAFFKEIFWLLALMIFVAGLVLIRLAQESLEHIDTKDEGLPKFFRSMVIRTDKVLRFLNRFIEPALKYVIPSTKMNMKSSLKFGGLFVMAFSVPFILGLDDFAGYVPLFDVVNLFGFAIGVFLGHMVLNIFLYISPAKTIKLVKNPVISLIGSFAFIGLALWGIFEATELLIHHYL